MAEANALTLAEYADRLAERTGVRASAPTLCRALRRLGLGAQKTLRAAEQDRPELVAERAAWRAELAQVDPDALGLPRRERDRHPDDARPRPRRPRRRGPVGKVPWGHWRRLTVIGALARDGVVACMSIAAATSTAVFLAFVEQVLVPALRDRPDAIVVMDNLAAHKAEAVREALAAAGIDYRYLPAYSPDLNPIEPCWSKLKTRLRARGARTWTRSRPNSAPRSPPSPPRMPRAGSASAATALPTETKTALVAQRP